MAKAIDLTARKVRSTVPQTPTAPPAVPQGIASGLPLPQGRIMTQSGGKLTPLEEDTLRAYGVKDGDVVPNNMAQILSQVAAEKQYDVDNLPPPVDPSHKPIQVEILDPDTATPEQKERIRVLMKESMIAQQAAAARRAGDARLASLPPSVRQAHQIVDAAAADLIVDDRVRPAPQPQAGMTVTATPHAGMQAVADQVSAQRKAAQEAATAPAAAPAPPAVSETGADAKQTHCPHCLWDLGLPDIPEPPYGDKIAFLHAVLGQKCFVKTYELFGGQVQVSFRTLTTREIEIIYKQAYRDVQQQRTLSDIDHWERINRYRLFLQLLNVRSTTDGKLMHDLPDGLSPETNPNAEACWKVEADEGETVIPKIEQYLVDEVFKTETLFRMITTQCSQFNRLVAKMEALVDNSDFWKKTEAPA